MGFFSGIKNWVGNLFDGDDEDDRKKKQQQNRQQSSYRNNSRSNAPRQSQNAFGVETFDFGADLRRQEQDRQEQERRNAERRAAEEKANQDAVQKELDRRKDEAYKRTLEQEKKQTSWLDRNIMDRGGAEKRAEIAARNIATREYQDEKGWNRDPRVISYGAETLKKANKNSEDSQRKLEAVNKVSDKVDSTYKTIDKIPVLSSVQRLASHGAEELQKATGNKADAARTANRRTVTDFDMTDEEVNALPDEQRKKLRNMQNLMTGAAPLDFLGLTGLLKSGVATAVKSGTKDLIKDGAVSQATKTAAKTGLKKDAVTATVGGVAGGGITAGAQEYLTGEVDMNGVMQGAFTGAGTSLLFGDPLKKAVSNVEVAPGVKSVNPNRQADANAQIEAEMAQMTPAPQMDPDPAVRAQAIADMQAASPASSLRKVPTQPAVAPEGMIPVRQPITNPEAAPALTFDPSDPTPAFMRRDDRIAAQNAADDAEIAAQRQQDAQFFDPLDAPAFERQGRVLPNQSPEVVIDGLRNSSRNLAADPTVAPLIQDAFMRTGSQDPLSLVTNALSVTQDKATVRALVQALIPDADGNVLNRAVNSVTGADNTPDILEALQVAATRAARDEPLGPVTPIENPVPITADPLENLTPEIPEISQQAPAVSGTVVPNDIPTDTPTAPTPAPRPAAVPTQTGPVADDTPLVPAAFAEPAKAEPASAPVKATAETTTAPKKAKAPAKTPQKDLVDTNLTKAAESGEIGKSKGKYSKGQEYEKTSLEATRQRGSDEAANTSYENFVKKIEEADGMTGKDRDTAVALQARQKVGTPEHRRLGDLINKYNTTAAQALGTIERTIRKTATADRLTNSFVNKLYKSTDDTLTINEKDFDDVVAKNEAFVKARDDQDAAIEAFNSNPTDANVDRVLAAFKAVDAADRAAKYAEYKTASRLGRKSKNPDTKKFIAELEKDAGVYTMDWVDSSMLSSSRVMINNFINTFSSRVEEQLFGKAGAALARKFTGQAIGGGSRKGAKLGAKLGMEHWREAAKLRQGKDENFLTKSIKNFTTTGNTIGDRNTYATAYSGMFDHYRSKLKKDGYKGDELDRRAMVNTLADPDNIANDYMNRALTVNAMGNITTGQNIGKIETAVAEALSRVGGDNKLSKVGAKAVTRILLGFPTVITRSLIQGGKRSMLGTGSLMQLGYNKATGGPAELRPLYVKNAVKEFGGGATMYTMGAALGYQGLITGGYPPASDQAERERWKREVITENSIKIGDDYYSLPAALGIFALPFMIGANASQNIRDGKPVTEDMAMDTVETVINAMPTNSIAGTLKFLQDIEQGRDGSKWLAQTGAGLTRAVTPLGSLVNQIAKSLDPTANDTTKGDALAQFWAKVQDGIPGLNTNLPSKTVDGKEIKNPGAIPRFFGAVSTSQDEGVKKTEQLDAKATAANEELKAAGLYTDKLRNILDDETKALFDRSKNGEKLDEKDMKKIQSGLTKGVTETEETRFLEDGDYDSNLAVLRLKKKMLEADPTTRKDTLDAYDDQITRGELYKELNVDYKTIKDYKEVSLEEWRDLGDPDSDEYDPELYEKLFDLDAAMTEKAVSRKSADKTEPKYYEKNSGSGRRSGSGRGRSSGGSRGGSRSDADIAAADALKKIQSNTIGGVQSLGNYSTGDLKPQKSTTRKIPQLQQIKSSELIKKRTIKVSKA